MKEVSCGVLLSYFEELRKRSISPETICKGIPYTLSHLRNKRERIEWDVFCTITSNVRPFLSDEEFTALGFHSSKRHLFFSASAVIVRLLFTGPELYSWISDPAKGPGYQMFTCILATTMLVGKNHVRTTLTLKPGYRHCREFFLLTKGAFTACTTLIGLEPARVEMREIECGAEYDIYCPEGGGGLSWLRRGLMWPFAARTAARELKEANEVLHERYGQLEEAQAKIQHQATQLRTAFSISEHIRRNLDLDATIEAVTQSLVGEGHFASAQLEVCLKTDVVEIRRLAHEGSVASDTRILSRALEARGQILGRFSVSLHATSDMSEVQELLDQVTPSIAMEISDALSFTLLTEYRNRDRTRQQEFSRQQIESQEAERKRLAAELHDGLGQDLLVASNELQQFLQGSEKPQENIGRAAELVQESIQTVREISSNLHPHHLDRLGFGAAIEAMAETIAHSTGITIKNASDNVDHLLPKETEIHMYRIVQEALSNVVRHASATRVDVQAKKGPRSVEIVVVDDGKGFMQQPGSALPSSPKVEKDRQGFGLSSMNERAKIIGGTLTVTSRPGEGTRVALIVPYS